MTKQSPGMLEVVCGSMFSGKTEELMYRLRRAEYAKKNVITIKHKIDNRKSYSCIVSHDGGQREAYPISSCEEGLRALTALVSDRTVDVIGIDEIQFFPIETVPIIQRLVDEGVRVIVAGLDLDFRGEPFGIVPRLMALADDVKKLRAVCMSCGEEANFTQRLINGTPAGYHDERILVGGQECYEPRCRMCYAIDIKSYLLEPEICGV
jgi:thymidine kinase